MIGRYSDPVMSVAASLPPDLEAALRRPGQDVARPLRMLGLFAHPDDEVFCVGGTIARAAAAGVETAIVSLTRGEAGQIRDSAAATRRTLGAVRAAELQASAAALGVAEVDCLDLGDGTLSRRPFTELVATARSVLERFRPDVVVTFGDDGAFGHPDHVLSARATLAAREQLTDPPRILQARFPARDHLLLDLLVEWLTSGQQRSAGSTGFGNALRLFADGSSMLGFAADHLHVQWFPAGSYVIEQGEAATELFCILSGTVDIVREDTDGTLRRVDTATAGAFVGQDGLAANRPRNAHVVARDDVTCFVLAPHGRDLSAARGAVASASPDAAPRAVTAAASSVAPTAANDLTVDVRAAQDSKIAALVAHRSQYALDAELLPRQVMGPLLATEYFTVLD